MSSALVVLPLALLYAWGVRRAPRRWPATRSLAALAGAIALASALGPLDASADRHLAAHMVQHILIGVVAPALFAVAAPLRLALAALPRGARRRLAGALHSRPGRVLGAPATAITLATATLIVSHVPAVMDAVLAHPLLHATEHAALFWTSLAAWVAVLGVDPVPGAPGPIGLLVALSVWMIAMATIGSQYATADHVLIASYADQPRALADQHAGGMIMWLGGLLTVAPVAVLGSLWSMWVEEQRQRRRDRIEAAR